MQLLVNGVIREVPEGITIATLLADLKVRREGVAVAVNQAVIPKLEHTSAALMPEDQVEIIQAVGGG